MKANEFKHPVIYQAPNGAIELRGDAKRETLWASQAQIAEVFDIDRTVVTKHIRNIFKDKEIDKFSVCANFAHTADDGKTYQVEYYNLDVILAVGYRTNSKQAIQFRQWATKTLRLYITEGFIFNKKRIEKNHEAFLKAVEEVRSLIPGTQTFSPEDTLSLVELFADTWFSLQAYDEERFSSKTTKKQIQLTAEELAVAITQLRNVLLEKREASDNFSVERSPGSIEGIIGNVMQSFGGEDLYPTLEEKAAHLLYFMVKNHPYVDGNKRSGAFAFVWFLKKAGALDVHSMTPKALTSLTLLIVESNPKDKDKLIGLVKMLL